MERLDLPELDDEQIEELCSRAEEAARNHVLSKVSEKETETLDVCAWAEKKNHLTLAIDVQVKLSSRLKDFDVKTLADEAVKAGFKSAEEYLRELACRSRR